MRLALLALFYAGGPQLEQASASRRGPADICEPNAECAAHSEKGRQLYASKKYDEALAEFEAAYGTQPEPLLLLNLGRCYHRLGQPRNALTQYRRFQKLVPTPDAKVRESLERYIAEARAEEDKDPSSQLVSATGGHEAGASKPVYKTWWFWTATGGAVAAAIILGVGLGVGLSQPGQPGYVDFTWRAK